MGSGKSSVGRALAEELGWNFIDLDEDIEKSAGAAISEIFEKQGEAAFRALETRRSTGVCRLAAAVNPK